MSEDISQAELEERVLEILYKQAKDSDGELSVKDLQGSLDGGFGGRRVELAIESLANASLVRLSHFMNNAGYYEITESGYKQVEEAYFSLLKATEAEKVGSDPIISIESKIVPAAGRMVSFGDNHEHRGQAVECVEQAQEIMRSSNTIDGETRNDAIANLSAWVSLVQKANSFAVGAFRFMVWDRIKKAIEKGLEDTYRAALTGILITLGTIIIGLL